MNSKNKIQIIGVGSALAVLALIVKNEKSSSSNKLSFEEKNVLFWQKRVYEKKIKFFIRVKAHNWDELVRNRDRFFVYFGKKKNLECLSFVPQLSYIAREEGVNIYYIDTSKQSTNPILKHLMEEIGVIKSPTLMFFDQGKMIKYDFEEQLQNFIRKYNV